MDADTRQRFALEEYIQTSHDWRHRDVLTWQLPSILVVVGGLLVAQAFDLPERAPQWIRIIILGFGAGLAFCLTWALLQNLDLQRKNTENLQKLYRQTQRFRFARIGSWLLFWLSVIVFFALFAIFVWSIFDFFLIGPVHVEELTVREPYPFQRHLGDGLRQGLDVV